jgi:hypothetical protein
MTPRVLSSRRIKNIGFNAIAELRRCDCFMGESAFFQLSGLGGKIISMLIT